VVASACGEPERADRHNMMSETVVTMDSSSNSASNNPRQQQPTVKTEPGQPGLLSGIRLNIEYFKTIPGIVKLVQVVS